MIVIDKKWPIDDNLLECNELKCSLGFSVVHSNIFRLVDKKKEGRSFADAQNRTNEIVAIRKICYIARYEWRRGEMRDGKRVEN